MVNARLIPCLLLSNNGLVKTVGFKNPRYIGDPINAVRIFNEKEVDEIIFLDITATKEGRTIDLNLVSKLSNESFIPLTVGGGIKTIDNVKSILNTGVEKVAVNTKAIETPDFINEVADIFGRQSIVVSIDVKRRKNGFYEVFSNSGTKSTALDPVKWALHAESMGAGEIFINSVDMDGTFQGYDIELIRSVSDLVDIPVIACGGAGSPEDLEEAIKQGHASAAAAGSLFVFYGRRKAVLINYPDKNSLKLGLEAWN